MTDGNKNTAAELDLVLNHLHVIENRMDELIQKLRSVSNNLQMLSPDENGTIHLEWVPGPHKEPK